MLRPPIQYSLYYTQHLNPSMNSLWYMTYIAYNIHVAAFIMCILTRIQVFVSYEPIFTFVSTYKYAIMECIATTTYQACIIDATLCISDVICQDNQDQNVQHHKKQVWACISTTRGRFGVGLEGRRAPATPRDHHSALWFSRGVSLPPWEPPAFKWWCPSTSNFEPYFGPVDPVWMLAAPYTLY